MFFRSGFVLLLAIFDYFVKVHAGVLYNLNPKQDYVVVPPGEFYILGIIDCDCKTVNEKGVITLRSYKNWDDTKEVLKVQPQQFVDDKSKGTKGFYQFYNVQITGHRQYYIEMGSVCKDNDNTYVYTGGVDGFATRMFIPCDPLKRARTDDAV